MNFVWHKQKATANRVKHGVSFEEAITAFHDPLSITIDDPDHSEYEPRSLLIGMSSRGRLLVVSHTDIDLRIRIVSARPATRRERWDYEEEG
jgi:uncharacterized DUF497 family protein